MRVEKLGVFIKEKCTASNQTENFKLIKKKKLFLLFFDRTLRLHSINPPQKLDNFNCSEGIPRLLSFILVNIVIEKI